MPERSLFEMRRNYKFRSDHFWLLFFSFFGVEIVERLKKQSDGNST